MFCTVAPVSSELGPVRSRSYCTAASSGWVSGEISPTRPLPHGSSDSSSMYGGVRWASRSSYEYFFWYPLEVPHTHRAAVLLGERPPQVDVAVGDAAALARGPARRSSAGWPAVRCRRSGSWRWPTASRSPRRCPRSAAGRRRRTCRRPAPGRSARPGSACRSSRCVVVAVGSSRLRVLQAAGQDDVVLRAEHDLALVRALDVQVAAGAARPVPGRGHVRVLRGEPLVVPAGRRVEVARGPSRRPGMTNGYFFPSFSVHVGSAPLVHWLFRSNALSGSSASMLRRTFWT